MDSILRKIDMNITRKKIQLISKDLDNMSKQTDIMNKKLNTINHIYDGVLYRKDPVGSSRNAIKYLKMYR